MVGDGLQGDEWPHALSIIEGDEWDLKYFGTNLRYSRNDNIIPSLPVRVEITGAKVHINNYYTRMRCLITTWNHDEQPVSFRGWLYLNGNDHV